MTDLYNLDYYMDELKLLELVTLENSPWQGRILPQGDVTTSYKERSMQQLIESIKIKGLMSPIIVRKINPDTYQIVDGHRRVNAYKCLQRRSIEALVRDYSDEQAQVFSMIGNLQRKNLSTIEKALAFKKILDSGLFPEKKEFSIAIGKDQTYVGDIIGTLQMDQRIIDDLTVNNSTDDVRLLRAIRRSDKAVDNHSNIQWGLYLRVINEGLTRSKLLHEIRFQKNIAEKRPILRRTRNRIIIEFDKQLDSSKLSEYENRILNALNVN